MKRGDITTDPMEIKRIIKEYYEPLYAQKFDILNVIDQFLNFIVLNFNVSDILLACLFC